jgi:hypothetical protein
MSNDTLSDVFLGFGSKTLLTLGTAVTATAVLYGIHKITGHGISALERLPKSIGISDMTEDEAKQPVITREQLQNESTAYIKIGGLIVIGVGLKYLGAKMDSADARELFNSVLYKH